MWTITRSCEKALRPLFVEGTAFRSAGQITAQPVCRIHRSLIVNISNISEFITLRNQDLQVKVKDKTVLRASRTFSEDLRKAIGGTKSVTTRI